MNVFGRLQRELQNTPRQWLVTGCAGFIGSNLLEFLLKHGQRVVGLDNFSTGYRHHLDEVEESVSEGEWRQFHLIEGDVRDLEICRRAVAGCDHVLHQAAREPAPSWRDDPRTFGETDVDDSLNMLVAARDEQVVSLVFAASDTGHDGHPNGPTQREIADAHPLAPCVVADSVSEVRARGRSRCHGLHSVGLRYANVFGQRQHTDGPYATVIAKWICAMSRGEDIVIHGDGRAAHDFCHVANVVQANILAALLQGARVSEAYNVGTGGETSLNQLFSYIRAILHAHGVATPDKPLYSASCDRHCGHVSADIGKASRELGYVPEYRVFAGLESTISWYLRRNPGRAVARRERCSAKPNGFPAPMPEMTGLIGMAAR